MNLFSRSQGHQNTEFRLLLLIIITQWKKKSRKIINRIIGIQIIQCFFVFFLFCKQERKEGGKRGRKPGRKASAEKIDMKAKLGMLCSNDHYIINDYYLRPKHDLLHLFLERSRQSARECRARKKLRYQYLEELVSDREKAVILLRSELEKVIDP